MTSEELKIKFLDDIEKHIEDCNRPDGKLPFTKRNRN